VVFFFFKKKKQKAFALLRRRVLVTQNSAKPTQGGLGGVPPRKPLRPTTGSGVLLFPEKEAKSVSAASQKVRGWMERRGSGGRWKVIIGDRQLRLSDRFLFVWGLDVLAKGGL
jgi:hypothetical protein